jgi:4-hydroxy-2-oxoheptanedioate aldolase
MRARQSLQERLSTKRALIGFLQTSPSLELAEMAGMCGCDFLLLDGEHGVFSERDYLQTLQVLAAVNVLAMVRLRNHDAQALGRYMDMGVDVIVVPNVATAEQATVLVRAMDYPPTGTRGFGASLHRGTRYGMDVVSHLKAPREGVSLLVIIESALGVANVDDILAVDGVDGVIVGPFDLAADLGVVGEFSQPAYSRAVGRVERAVAVKGKILGTAPHPGSTVEDLLTRGHRLLVVGTDVLVIREAMSAAVAKASCYLET